MAPGRHRVLVPPHVSEGIADLDLRAGRTLRATPTTAHVAGHGRRVPLPRRRQQPDDIVPFQHASDRCLQGGGIPDRALAPPRRGRPRPPPLFLSGPPLLQGGLLALGQRWRTHNLHAFRPAHGLSGHHGAQWPLKLVAGPQQALPVPEQRSLLRAHHAGRDPALDLRGGLARQRQWHQIKVVVRGDLSPRGQCRHLAIACVQQARASHDAPHPLKQWGIERIIRTLARVDIASDQVPRRLRGSCHQFQLRQVGTVILAMASLHHPLFGHVVVAIARRAVQANPCQLELVHCHRRRPQVAFDRVPRLVLTQTIQDAPQPIIAELHLPDRVSQQVFQGVGHAVRPVPHSRFAVIGLRQDVG
jgi:hypothetical protein